MPIVKYSAEDARRIAKRRPEVMARATEAAIARHAARDGTATDDIDFAAAFKGGRLRIVSPLDVAAIRAKTGLSQERFARAFQISPHTLRNWEQARRIPDGPARALLTAIDRNPKALIRALGA